MQNWLLFDGLTRGDFCLDELEHCCNATRTTFIFPWKIFYVLRYILSHVSTVKQLRISQIRRSHVIIMREVCWDLGVWFVDWVMKNNFYLFGQSPVRGGERPHMLELNYRHSLLIINNKLHTETVMLLSSKTLATHIHDPTNYFRIFILIQSCSVY